MNNRNSKNHVQNVKNYQRRRKKIYPVFVDVAEDADVIEWFEKQPSKGRSNAVRMLIRDSINKRAASKQAIARLRQSRREQKACIYCNTQDERTLSGKASCQKCFDKYRSKYEHGVK